MAKPADPDGVDELTLLVDRDASGEKASLACAQTWEAAGRQVRRLRTQDPALNDFNDLVRAKLATANGSAIDWSSGIETIKPDDYSGIPLTIDEWLSRELPALDPILGEVFTTTTRAMLHANTGLGKTMFCLDAWLHAAGGKDFLHWRCPRPRRMLFIDGEMSRRLLRERLEGAVQRLGVTPPDLYVFNREDIPDFAPLNTRNGQAAIWRLTEEVARRAGGWPEGIGFDNVMSLVGGDMKEEDAWRETMPLIMELTRRRIGQLWVHHTGHDTSRGYGTKTREWNLDVVMHLDKVDHAETDVAFTLSFPKARERGPRNREDFDKVKLALVADQWTRELQLMAARRRRCRRSASSGSRRCACRQQKLGRAYQRLPGRVARRMARGMPRQGTDR